MIRRGLTRLRDAREGVSAVEFGLLATPFLLLIMGTLDLGYQAYLRALTTGALERAARKATVGNQTKDQVVTLIKTEVGAILPANARDDTSAITVTPLSYYNFSAVGGGERITGDTAPVGTYNSTDCYEDRNNNGHYDATAGGGDDLGSADDILYYNVVVSVPRFFPFLTAKGFDPKTTVTARTLIRNQPYGEQQVKIRCS